MAKPNSSETEVLPLGVSFLPFPDINNVTGFANFPVQQAGKYNLETKDDQGNWTVVETTILNGPTAMTKQVVSGPWPSVIFAPQARLVKVA